MAKRFTDTEKWKDEWYLSLSNDYKIVWQYLLDNCSIAGIIKKNFKLLNFCCEVNLDEITLLKIFKERVFNCGQFYFIPKFLKFQYPKGLGSDKPAIISVRNELLEKGLINEQYEIINERLINDCLIIKDKDKDTDTVKDTDQEQDQDTDKAGKIEILIPPIVPVFNLQNECRKIYEEFHLSSTGVKYYYDAKSAGALRDIIKKIKNISTKESLTDQDILKGFAYILKNLNDEFTKDNLDLSMINSQFNKIIPKIKNGNSKYKGYKGDTNKWQKIFRDIEASKTGHAESRAVITTT